MFKSLGDKSVRSKFVKELALAANFNYQTLLSFCSPPKIVCAKIIPLTKYHKGVLILEYKKKNGLNVGKLTLLSSYKYIELDTIATDDELRFWKWWQTTRS